MNLRLSQSTNDYRCVLHCAAKRESAKSGALFGEQLVVTTNAQGADSVVAADINGDGFLDLVSASYNDAKIAWYQNLDGKGTFGFFFIFF